MIGSYASRLGLVRLLTALLAAMVCASPAGAEGWHSEQPPPPPATGGQSGVGVPVPLGHVGDIEFWAPNRGLLITAGNEAVPEGLYYYDGVTWHELSNVCGGTDGRIAWAGPDEFWTIADQQAGQQGIGSPVEEQDRSLCHFVNGKVVASYAEPIGVPGSYQRMDAATCSGANNCWFAGERLPAGLNSGAFHLHWNGKSVSPLPSLEAPEPQVEDPNHQVTDLAFFNGRLYESVHVQAADPPSNAEPASSPFLLHRIQEGASNPFAPLTPKGPLREVKSPGEPPSNEPFSDGASEASQLSGFDFSASSAGLWAIAGPASPESPAHVTALLMEPGAGNPPFQQIALKDSAGVFAPGTQVAGIAAESGTNSAWISLDANEPASSAQARIVRIATDGSVGEEIRLPGSSEGIARMGAAGPIACPAPGDCWMVTSTGWLFHLGGNYPQDEDPNFQTLISSRPEDGSLPFVPPDEQPIDDSGDEPVSIPPASAARPVPKPASARRRAPLFSKVSSKVKGHSTLALSFTLATRSRVRLVALRHAHRVANTKRYTLAHGRHTLELRLNPHAWPTKLDLQVKALGSVPLLPAGSGPEAAVGGPTQISTSELTPTAPLISQLVPKFP